MKVFFFTKNMPGIGIILLLLLFIFMPSSSLEALEKGERIATHNFRPGAMVFLGGILIGVAGLARKKGGNK